MERLDKVLSNLGYGTRKELKKICRSGLVEVNGEIAKDSGMQVDPENDKIIINGEEIFYRKFIYLMMNKPDGVVSATYDNRDETVIDLLEVEHQVFEPFPVGRLDKDTVGLLLLTNDGELNHRLISPKWKVDKVYYAILDGVPKKQSDTLVDYLTKDTKTNMVSVTNAKVGKKSILHYQVLATKNGHTLVEIHLETGRPHQIRVQFASRNLPLVGDQRYNKNAKKVQIALWAVSLTFPHPTTKDKITIHSDPPEIWPWTEFEVKLWQK